MSGYVMAPVGFHGDLAVAYGPRLLAGVESGASYAEHRRLWAPLRPMAVEDVVTLTERIALKGRGGAGFPFHRKLATAAASGRKRTLVVNGAEGEPGSAKDSALLITQPHLVLDGAELVAAALDCDEVRVIVPSERAVVSDAVRTAVVERSTTFAYEIIPTAGGFVSGQARAVIELAEGRENLPVTSWAPEAVSGIGKRPTLLSNAETYAQVAVAATLGAAEYCRVGTADEPGTTLLTVAGDGPGGVVLEVPFGIGLAQVLEFCGYPSDGPVLLGGYHGTWLPAAEVARRAVSRRDLSLVGATLGAGVVLPLDPASCPVEVTARIVEYLAAHSARRCGPCRNGLPAMAEALDQLSQAGDPGTANRVKELGALVTGRGACAHPDGTSRLVRSMFTAFDAEVNTHLWGRCSVRSDEPGSWGALSTTAAGR